ncbi:heat shock cognate 71 kDa protein-like isoform X2 [Nasonia vitripennis]|nr:heat shock cognate 71 kDa protein-like isoform X2 [Nasonia vitripennis]XP_031789160.1 heat shock cognate 71 kDa protein-like isoform X2 [Nasonia vitripennis]XP_031789161.1 heat shock cognate 71 kDa protein-like isoform X2 [Nasonia vitripennis]XP_031789162.1 heat shock cognate 71 kDa protein-like isoform X2 [Nasonia vitripennis]XP_031789163.1 heat shock cognate 71 kDa protein-like isoform X2 [Nasonia vitripennis]XP_031789164.1 heat shock cognate 71 kDa protein-like isoform X2 [Nasonia vitrip
MSEVPSIGIDLGTTNTVIAAWIPETNKDLNSTKSSGTVNIIANSKGHRTTPSCVAFNEKERLIGTSALSQGQRNSKNTIYSSKRLIGREFDNEVKAESEHWPFAVVDKEGRPFYEVNHKSEIKYYSPQDIASMILEYVKQFAESYLTKKITDVVITVPANFNTIQREATKFAGEMAVLNVSIISEPIAAALAYGLNHKINYNDYVLIFDLGGGTFDVSVVTMQNDILIVEATSGDQHLGGEDFTNILLEHFTKEFNSKYDCEIQVNEVSVKRLYNACENAKLELSDSASANIDEFALFDGHDFCATITRDKFEELCDNLFQKILKSVELVLSDAKVQKSDIKNIVLVGGSTRILKIQDMLKDFFGKELDKSINPDEAVAYGAALQASMIHGNMENLLLVDVTPLSLGVQVGENEMSILIKRNTRLPFSKARNYTTARDNQQKVEIKVYEGEDKNVNNNLFLDKFTLMNIPPGPKGTPTIIVTFDMNNNGILIVSAVIKSNEHLTKKIHIDRRRCFSHEKKNPS